MRKVAYAIFAVLLIFSFPPNVAAEELLKDCREIINDRKYEPLREYFSETGKSGSYCQRLNKREFVYIGDENIYYCNSVIEGALSCDEHEDGVWFPDLSVVHRFFGQNGKGYVLLKASRLSHGVFSSGYHAFFLVPRSVNNRGYSVFYFRDAGEAYSESGHLCADLGKKDDAVKSLSIPFQILHQVNSNPIVRFNQEITSCKSGHTFIQTLEYTWQNGGFMKTLDNKKVVRAERDHSRPLP